MTRHREAGFTLMEVMVSSVIMAIVMVGMSTILINYASSRGRINGLAIARIICESEVDDILLHNQIENSLVSDTGGRSRAILLVGRGLTVSNYYYCNFPAGVNHDMQGMWDPANPTNYNSRFGRNVLYSSGGVKLYEYGMLNFLAETDPSVDFIVRRQLYGVSTNQTDIEGYVVGGTATQPIDYYNSTTDNPALIADTCRNLDGNPFPLDGKDVKYGDATYNSYDQKIFVVRVYTQKTFLTYRNGTRQPVPNTFHDPTVNKAKIELTHAYTVINGKIRL